MRPHPAQRLRAPTALPPSGPEIASVVTPGSLLGPWRLTESLGPHVHAAVDVRTGEAVVVKAAGPAAAAEIAALAALRHPHLVRFAGAEAGLVATARIPGPSLAGLLAARGRVSWRAAAAMLAPVADALAAVHAAGWVHGDVSASNVVVGPDATGVLVDLGRARPVGALAAPAGTPGSVAPEVEAGVAGGPAADVFSLAAVVVEAVTGVPPTAATVLPPGVALALRRALAPDPAARPAAAELAAALRAAAGPQPVSGSRGIVAESDAPTLEDAGTRVTRDYGPRPPAPVLDLAESRPRRWPILLSAAAAAATAGAFVLARPPTSAPTEAAAPPACAPVAPGALTGDPDGDGCPVAATWVAGVLTVVVEPGEPPRRYALGAPGDVVALDDWDCDGDDTPGLYRPATGVVTLYSSWPVAGPGAAPSSVTTGEGLPDPGC